MTTFGDLLRQHLSRKHGLSQNKLATGIFVDPSVISRMCNGERLKGIYSRDRVLKIITWFHSEGVLDYIEEANALLKSAKMLPLQEDVPQEADILLKLETCQSEEAHTSQFLSYKSAETEISLPIWELGALVCIFLALLVNLVNYILIFITLRTMVTWYKDLKFGQPS